MSRLRYSDRQMLAENGTLGDPLHDRVPDELAQAIRVIGERGKVADSTFEARLTAEPIEHFGRGAQWFTFFSGGGDVRAFLDAIEILAEQAAVARIVPDYRRPRRTIPDAEERINRAFQRFRFGYVIEGGEVRRIGSAALDEVVVGPALLAVQRPGWEEAERSFREALDHQRGGETDDALTAANAAVEAALKAVGMKGQTLPELARSFKGSGLVPGYLGIVPERVEDMLSRLHVARSEEGDVHGKDRGAEAVPQALADLGVYWAGAFIVYLAETTSTPYQSRATVALPSGPTETDLDRREEAGHRQQRHRARTLHGRGVETQPVRGRGRCEGDPEFDSSWGQSRLGGGGFRVTMRCGCF